MFLAMLALQPEKRSGGKLGTNMYVSLLHETQCLGSRNSRPPRRRRPANMGAALSRVAQEAAQAAGRRPAAPWGGAGAAGHSAPDEDAEWGLPLVDDHEGVVQQYGGVPVCGIVPSSAGWRDVGDVCNGRPDHPEPA